MSNGWRRKVVCYAIAYRKTRPKSSAYGNGKGKKMVGSGGKMEVSLGDGVSEGSNVLVGVGVSVGVGVGVSVGVGVEVGVGVGTCRKTRIWRSEKPLSDPFIYRRNVTSEEGKPVRSQE